VTARGLVAAVCLLVVAACGSADSGVSEPAGRLLTVQVEAIRAAAGGADRASTAQRLAQLRETVTQLRADGELSSNAAAKIRRAAAAVAAQLDLLPIPTTTTTTTTTPVDTRPEHSHGSDRQDQRQKDEKGANKGGD
jgi:hypothetical protein